MVNNSVKYIIKKATFYLVFLSIGGANFHRKRNISTFVNQYSKTIPKYANSIKI